MMIVFSGTDGAGKSTQIDLLVKRLANTDVRILWGRGGYTPLFEFSKNIVRKLVGKKIPTSGNTDARAQMFKKKSVSGIWLTIATIDLFLYFGLYTRYLSFTGKTVICDRYIEDTQIDFKRNFPEQFNQNSFLWRMLLKSLPVADYSFLLYVPFDVSLVRSKLKNEPFPDSSETLNYRLQSYMDKTLFPPNKYHKIECRQPVEVIQEEIQREIFKTSE